MPTGIYVFGHGGGVPFGDAGNTNFALIPNLPDIDPDPNSKGDLDPYHLLARYPYWLIDCGPGTMLKVCGCWPGFESTVHNLRGIILTHAHADHAGGLASLAWRLKFDPTLPKDFKVDLVAHTDLWPMLAQQLVELCYHNPAATKENGGPFALDAYFGVFEYIGAFATTGFNLRIFPVNHNIVMGAEGHQDFPAYGLRIWSEGKTIVFSGDTAKVLSDDLLNEADVVFHDCQFYSDGKDGKHVHCPFPDLAALPENIRAKTYLAHTIWEPPAQAYEAGFKWAHKGRLINL